MCVHAHLSWESALCVCALYVCAHARLLEKRKKNCVCVCMRVYLVMRVCLVCVRTIRACISIYKSPSSTAHQVVVCVCYMCVHICVCTSLLSILLCVYVCYMCVHTIINGHQVFLFLPCVCVRMVCVCVCVCVLIGCVNCMRVCTYLVYLLYVCVL